VPNGGWPLHLLLVVEPDHVLVVSGRNVALHQRWPEDDPPQIAGEKIADLSDDQVSALVGHLEHWGARAQQAPRQGPGIFLDW
jgi:hypothetical protein